VTELIYENRPAKRMPALNAETFLDGSFQSGFEDALSDQLPQASRMKKLYNIFDTRLALPVIHALSREGRYVGFRDICFFRDMLVVRPLRLSEKTDKLRESAGIINTWAKALPDTAFYVYYIETDRDMNLQNGEKSGLYDCLSAALTLPAAHVSRLRVDSYDDYSRMFFRTDHHWNAAGSRQGLLDVCAMLSIEPPDSTGVFSVPACYRGTRAAGVEGFPAEDFAVNLYALPEMAVRIPYGPIPDYGMQQLFLNGELETVSYGSVFGVDCGELLLDTGKPGERLLVLGDSYDNALAKPLASGFSQCWFVDLRSYAAELGRPFALESWLKEHEVNRVLLVGGIDYFGETLPDAEGG